MLLRVVLCLCLYCFVSGCVRRRLMVRTNPPGASVFVDKQPIGTSPAATSFTYYGTREIEVVRDGYRTEKVLRTITPPWYELPPLDFISETLWPREIRDERIVDITLVPAQTVASEVLQARADGLRLQVSQGVATPLPPPTSGQDFRGGVVFPGNLPPGTAYPTQPIDPTFQSPSGPILSTPEPVAPTWRPGQVLGNFFQPNGTPPARIPEAGILPGGGYRPEIE